MITILVSMPIINIQAQAQSISNLDSWCAWMGDNEKNKKILQQMPLSSERSSHDSNSFKQFIFVLTTLFKFQVSFLGFCLVFFGNYGNFMLNDWRKCVHLGLSGDFNYTKVIVCGRKCRKQEAHFTFTKKCSPSSFIFEWHHWVIGGSATPNAFVCFVVHSSIARTTSKTHTPHRTTTATSFNWLKLCLFRTQVPF